MGDENKKPYELRDNPRRTEKYRAIAETRRDRRQDRDGSEEREGPQEDVNVESLSLTVEGTSEVGTEDEHVREAMGTSQETIVSDKEIAVVQEDVRTQHEVTNELSHGDYVGNPNEQTTHNTQMKSSNRETEANPLQHLLTVLHDLKSELKLELGSKIEQSQNDLKQSQNDIKQSQNDLKQEMKRINLNLTKQSVDINDIHNELANIRQEIREEINRQIDSNNDVILEKIEDKLLNFEIRQEKQNQLNQELCVQTTIATCESFTENISQEIKQRHIDNLTTKGELNNFRKETETRLNNVHDTIQTHTTQIYDNQESIKEIKKSTENLKDLIGNINKGTTVLESGAKEITIYCQGTENTEAKLKFNGRERNPLEFVNKLRRYIQKLERTGRKNRVNLEELLDNAMEDTAARWWQMVKRDITTIDEFEHAITEKYWNREIQRGVKRRMELERFRPQGRLSRAEYFTDRVITLRNMTPTMDEAEIVTFLAEQFEKYIQEARRIQNVNTINEFEKLLSREDVEDQHNNIRNRNQERPDRYDEWRSRNEGGNAFQNNYRNYNQKDRRQYNFPATQYNGRRNDNSYQHQNQQKQYQTSPNRDRYHRPQNTPQQNYTPYNHKQYIPTPEQQRQVQFVQLNQPPPTTNQTDKSMLENS